MAEENRGKERRTTGDRKSEKIRRRVNSQSENEERRAHIRMRTQKFQQADFAEGVPCVPFVVGVRPDSLDGDVDFADRVIRGADDSERSLAQDPALLQNVPGIDRKSVAVHSGGHGFGEVGHVW